MRVLGDQVCKIPTINVNSLPNTLLPSWFALTLEINSFSESYSSILVFLIVKM